MSRRCDYRGCGLTQSKRKDISIFRYPINDYKRCVTWFDNASVDPNIQELLESEEGKKKLIERGICSLHFDKKYFNPTFSSQRKLIKNAPAVPQVFNQWVKRCGSEEAKRLEVDESVDSTKRICSLHFHEDDMYFIGRCRSLLRHALPHDCRGVYGDLINPDSAGEKSAATESQEFVDIGLPQTTVKSESSSAATSDEDERISSEDDSSRQNLDDNTVDSVGPEFDFSETSQPVTKLEQPSHIVTYTGRRGRSKTEVCDEVSVVEQPVEPKDVGGFCGFASLKTESDLLEFCGISAKAFQLLFSLIPAMYMNTNLTSREDHLLIFLLQMKTGISSAMIKILFSIPLSDETTQGIFSSILSLLKEPTQKFIVWPDKQAVIDTMPDVFQKNFSSCRVILYCLYVPFKSITSLSSAGDVLSITTGRSKKFLIGFTPSGAIIFVSKAFPANFSLLKMISYSKVLKLLDRDDSAFLVLDENHQYESNWKLLSKHLCVKRISILFPPQNQEEFMNPVPEKIILWAHAISHIKRLKSHKILSSCGWERIYFVVDYIVSMACVLANLQPLQ